MVKLYLSVLSCVFFVAGCTKDNPVNNNPSDSNPPPKTEKPLDKKPLIGFVPEICSALNFDNVTWPASYSEQDKVAFSLALNITGSFEGHAGWSNLSNNFDGQGFSLGILNQNLGQGTIQPLLIKMRDQHMAVLESYFSDSMLATMFEMLEVWEASQPTEEEMKKFLRANQFLERELVDILDDHIDKMYGIKGVHLHSNKKSVEWAKKTIYSDKKARKFKPEWKTALKDMAEDPVYVSLQIAAAQELHDQARGDQLRLQWTQLRAYLFLFDIVVQNGGLKEKHFEKFALWLKEQSRATEQEQMLEMLEIRVVDSHPKWQKDVRLRKTTIIVGSGFVHGEDRNLPVEYCYDPMISY